MSKKFDEASMTNDIVGFLTGKKKKSKKKEVDTPWYLKNTADLKVLVLEIFAEGKSSLQEDNEKIDLNLAKSYNKLKNRLRQFQANPELQKKNPDQFQKLQQFFDKVKTEMGDTAPELEPEKYASDKSKSYLNVKIGDLPSELKQQLNADVANSSFKNQARELSDKMTLGSLLRKMVGSKTQDRDVVLSPGLVDKIKNWHAQNKMSLQHQIPKGPDADQTPEPTLGRSKIGSKSVIDPDLSDEELKNQFGSLAKRARDAKDTEDRSLASKMKVRGKSGVSRSDIHQTKNSPLSMKGIDQELEKTKQKSNISDPKGSVAEFDLDLAMAERGDKGDLPARTELRNAYKKMAMNILHDPNSNFHMDIIDGIAQRTGVDPEEIEAIKDKMWPNGEFNKSLITPPGEEEVYDAVKTYFSPSRLIKNPQFVDALRDYMRNMYFGAGYDPLVPEEEAETGVKTPQLKAVFQKMLGSASPEDADREMASMKIAEPALFKSKYRQALKILKNVDKSAWKKELEQSVQRTSKKQDNFTKGLNMAKSEDGPDPDQLLANFQARKKAKELGQEPGKFELDPPKTPEEYENMVQKNKQMNQYDRVKTRQMMKQPPVVAPEKKRADVINLIQKAKEKIPMKKAIGESLNLVDFFFEKLTDLKDKKVDIKEKSWEGAPLSKKKNFQPKFDKQKMPGAKK